MQIEELEARHLHRLTELRLALWPGETDTVGYADAAALMASERETCFLARQNGRYIGFVQLSLRYEFVEGAKERPAGYVEGIYVEPRCRHSGVGRALMDRAKQWARDRGCTQLASDTEVDNAASRRFHARIGFREVAQTVCFIQDL